MAKDSQKKTALRESFHPRQTSYWHSGAAKPSEGRMNDPRAGFEQLLAELRPKLHRYCARMTGSVIDGEDVLQDAMAKAIEAFPHAGPIAHPEGWLFRIAHNAALDFLRRRTRQENVRADQDLDMIADPDSSIAARPPPPACAP
jgi:RNA polymerase sigma-70 factor (ECF subfamily)